MGSSVEVAVGSAVGRFRWEKPVNEKPSVPGVHEIGEIVRKWLYAGNLLFKTLAAFEGKGKAKRGHWERYHQRRLGHGNQVCGG